MVVVTDRWDRTALRWRVQRESDGLIAPRAGGCVAKTGKRLCSGLRRPLSSFRTCNRSAAIDILRSGITGRKHRAGIYRMRGVWNRR
jgi:hypothetical protein